MATFVAIFKDNKNKDQELQFEAADSYTFSDFCMPFNKIVKNFVVEPEEASERAAIKIQVYKLVVENGAIAKKYVGKFRHQLPIRRLESHEYEAKLQSILSELPQSFRAFVSNQSWDRGHSSGYEEVLNIAQEIVSELAPAVKEYRQFLLSVE